MGVFSKRWKSGLEPNCGSLWIPELQNLIYSICIGKPVKVSSQGIHDQSSERKERNLMIVECLLCTLLLTTLYALYFYLFLIIVLKRRYYAYGGIIQEPFLPFALSCCGPKNVLKNKVKIKVLRVSFIHGPLQNGDPNMFKKGGDQTCVHVQYECKCTEEPGRRHGQWLTRLPLWREVELGVVLRRNHLMLLKYLSII